MDKNISLLELMQNGHLVKTGAKPKLPIQIPNVNDGMLDVYRIPLKYLYYNAENGRIASAISRQDIQLEPARDDENPEYNQLIAKMIVEDNAAKLKQTKKSIRESGQKVFGYVLADGRVIDGNRRYTALRQLAEETGETYLFEAVILPFTYASKTERAEIKRLELAIQMGTEERQAYDPVDLAVDIYQTVVVDKLMTENDYAKEANIKQKEIKNRTTTVMLMREFLEFINAKENAYHIIKDTKLYNPLYELAKKLNTQFPKKGPAYEQSKITSFALLTKMLATGGDTVREVRDYFKDVLTTTANEDFNDAIEDSVDNLRDTFEEHPVTSATEFRRVIEIASPEIREINGEYVRIRNRQNRGKNIDSFIGDVKETLNSLRDMQKGEGLTGNLNFNNFSKDQINEIREYLIQINLISRELIEIYDDEI
ncbi:hypothetical protein [Bacillus cereus]|uniref:hypothetical protein n=1 Tax=Bacillus cereus TaxID=1396 RepID=UPI0020D2835B|nr:hypothetical protein [Bacillus cereus]